MKLIVETDLGHDPDDFFAITYLLAAGVQIDAIFVTPGDPDQLAIAQLIRDEASPKTLIGSDIGRTKMSSGSIHHDMLKRYGRSLQGHADHFGDTVMRMAATFETEAFVIGPVSNIGAYLGNGGPSFKRATMQGGFVPYSKYRPEVTLDKFETASWMPTFNLNGDIKGAKAFLSANMPRQMVGKNVCHTIEFTRERFAQFAKPTNRAGELFHEAASLYFARHPAKKFHDPTAAVCHLHPEIGLWIDGKTTRMQGGWTTFPGEDQVLVDIDRERLWHHLSTLT
jgi:pyrimidine-specific ribonucleoside hydrolase